MGVRCVFAVVIGFRCGERGRHTGLVLKAQGESRYKGESEDVTFKVAVVSSRENVGVRHHGAVVKAGGRVPRHEGERSAQRQC